MPSFMKLDSRRFVQPKSKETGPGNEQCHYRAPRHDHTHAIIEQRWYGQAEPGNPHGESQNTQPASQLSHAPGGRTEHETGDAIEAIGDGGSQGCVQPRASREIL